VLFFCQPLAEADSGIYFSVEFFNSFLFAISFLLAPIGFTISKISASVKIKKLSPSISFSAGQRQV